MRALSLILVVVVLLSACGDEPGGEEVDARVTPDASTTQWTRTYAVAFALEGAVPPGNNCTAWDVDRLTVQAPNVAYFWQSGGSVEYRYPSDAPAVAVGVSTIAFPNWAWSASPRKVVYRFELPTIGGEAITYGDFVLDFIWFECNGSTPDEAASSGYRLLAFPLH